jgi:pyruvate ferredoxin oxidoreductase alpha subunit
MMVSARAFNSPNLSIWNSWEFTLFDLGWNCIFSENVQETYDASIIASKIGEETLFPTMFVHDGFITSHSSQKFWAIPHADVMKYTPKKPRHHINTQKTGTWGSVVTPSYCMENRKMFDDAKLDTLKIMDNCFREFEKLTGRAYHHIETFNLGAGCKTAFITMGSMCGNILTWMQKANRKDIGLIKLRTWRPFPVEELRKIVKENHIEKLIVLEKDDDMSGLLPPVGRAIATALFGMPVVLRAFITGLGGRDVTKDEIEYAANKMESVKDMNGRLYDYLGVRETKDKIAEVRF